MWVAITRNEGLDMAKWEYIAFCDGDDMVHPYMYWRLYDTCESMEVDTAIAMTKVVDWFNSYYRYPTVEKHPEKIVLYSNEDMFRTRAVKWENMFRAACWNRIVKREVATKTKFPEWYTWPWVLYEDVAYTSSLYSYIDKFAFVKDIKKFIGDKNE